MRSEQMSNPFNDPEYIKAIDNYIDSIAIDCDGFDEIPESFEDDYLDDVHPAVREYSFLIGRKLSDLEDDEYEKARSGFFHNVIQTCWYTNKITLTEGYSSEYL